jgi:hypothetical protein
MMAALLLLSLLAAAGANNPSHTTPNLIMIVADDLGHNDVGWANNRTITPSLDLMVQEGMELMQFYTFKYCAPTRGALHTGRYPFHFGFYTNQDSNNYGVPTNFTMLLVRSFVVACCNLFSLYSNSVGAMVERTRILHTALQVALDIANIMLRCLSFAPQTSNVEKAWWLSDARYR